MYFLQLFWHRSSPGKCNWDLLIFSSFIFGQCEYIDEILEGATIYFLVSPMTELPVLSWAENKREFQKKNQKMITILAKFQFFSSLNNDSIEIHMRLLQVLLTFTPAIGQKISGINWRAKISKIKCSEKRAGFAVLISWHDFFSIFLEQH